MEKEFYVKAILAYRYSVNISGDNRVAICRWCDERTSMVGLQEKVDHAEDCPYLLASKE